MSLHSMKIDVISIFPEYLSPLKLSLLGKAQSSGLLEIEVHDHELLSQAIQSSAPCPIAIA